jgi:hypothetical protein
MSSKIYPIGIQNFEKIRKDGYFYIDKTALIYKLVKTGSYYFLSRPRRFGKSLLLSTLEAYFKGRKELFEGLAMESLEKDWIEYPVIHLDLNAKKFDTENDLIRLIDRQLLVYEAQYGSCSSDETIDDRLVTLIRLAAEKTGQLRLYPVAGRPTPRWNAQPNSVYISPASSILLWSYSWIILLLTEKISGERSMALIISPI